MSVHTQLFTSWCLWTILDTLLIQAVFKTIVTFHYASWIVGILKLQSPSNRSGFWLLLQISFPPQPATTELANRMTSPMSTLLLGMRSGNGVVCAASRWDITWLPLTVFFLYPSEKKTFISLGKPKINNRPERWPSYWEKTLVPCTRNVTKKPRSKRDNNWHQQHPNLHDQIDNF